jgi:RNA polymerase sigma factor (sigma-70 family)
MSESNRLHLKKLLVSRYAHLVKRLERVAGSKDGAADALHETWLRLGTANVPASVANGDAYILGIASHVVVDGYRREQRYVSEEEIDQLLEVPDELSDPERIVAARLKVEALKGILRGLTPRRRAILLAARVEGQMNREISERFGISLRLVEKELGVAMQYCLERMNDMADPTEASRTGRRKF